ncbi:MAG: cyclopropane fatty acyl phospholipid synthase [Alphaproteobacteria bacterium]|nr:cyclopropane fatty acyl phospholipid synthase [Alphaproteobacteria bacterium]
MSFRGIVERVLASADVRLDGDRPWDVRVHDPRFFRSAVLRGTLGVGESYVDGWWDCDALDELVARVGRSSADDLLPDWGDAALRLSSRLVNLQSTLRASQVAERHYDLGNAFFREMLGPTMTYSCGYWAEAETLEQAQAAKMDLICRKLGLQEGDRILDIGCGWGSLLRHAAERYGCEGLGISVSAPQIAWAREHSAGLPLRFETLDYRSPDLKGPFHHIVSVGMFEHVGRKNHRVFLARARALLAEGGLLLLHTIGNDHAASDPWLHRYIFPNGELPSTRQLARALQGLFVLEDWHNFRLDYWRTIRVWAERFRSPDPRFTRLWRFYLLSMAGTFKAGGRNQLWQLVLSPHGVADGYRSPR